MFTPEKIDLMNVEKLKDFSDTEVVMSFQDLEKRVLMRNKDV